MKSYFLILAICILIMFSVSGQTDVRNKAYSSFEFKNKFSSHYGGDVQTPIAKIWNESCSIWTKGRGTQNAPYLIEALKHVFSPGFIVNNNLGPGTDGHTVGIDQYWRLVINIDLKGIEWGANIVLQDSLQESSTINVQYLSEGINYLKTTLPLHLTG